MTHREQPFKLCFACTRMKLKKPFFELCSACTQMKNDEQRSRLCSPRNPVKLDEKTSKLCSRCSQIDPRWKWGCSHHDLVHLTASSTEDHCPLCKLFLESSSLCFNRINKNFSPNITIIPTSTGNKLGYKVQNQRGILFEIVRGTESNIFETSGEQHDIEQINTNFRLTSAIPSDDQNMSVINQWLRSCTMEHDRCKQTPSTSLPTRLLDISGPQVRLISPRGKTLRYTILSHCWGDNTRLVTTESTVELFRQEIDWLALPATFKDAITTSRKLKIDYIWIDSLCICQDSRIDWERECQNMGDYYKNAYLTISALDSPDSDAGFLHPRKNLAVELSTPDTWLRPCGRVSNTIFRESYLNKRGWALQERLISTRILHFSKDELLWECLTCSATESSFKEHHELVDSSSLIHSEGQDFKRAALHLGPDPYSLSHGTFAAWYRIVKQFSRRSLTYETDRLPAISGVARLIGERTGFTYIAGLWEQDPHGLVWCIDKPGDRVSHPSTTRKDILAVDFERPSWSWAKMKHSVSWPFYDQARAGTEGDAKIVQSKIVSIFSDPYRATKTTELELEATTLDVQCMYWAKYEKWTLEIVHDGLGIGVGCYDDPVIAESMADCIAINIAERKDEPSSYKYHYFLLVQRSSQESGAWERIGMGMTRNKAFEGLPKQVIRLR